MHTTLRGMEKDWRMKIEMRVGPNGAQSRRVAHLPPPFLKVPPRVFPRGSAPGLEPRWTKRNAAVGIPLICWLILENRGDNWQVFQELNSLFLYPLHLCFFIVKLLKLFPFPHCMFYKFTQWPVLQWTSMWVSFFGALTSFSQGFPDAPVQVDWQCSLDRLLLRCTV